MPSCLSDCLKAQDLRLLHAAVKIARCHLQRFLSQPKLTDHPPQKILDLLRQAEAIATAEMHKNNLLPALSAAELRDEQLPDNEIPRF